MLQNATYLNHNGNRVREAWLNSSLVWSIPFNTFWTYPSNTTTISNLNITTTQGDILVNWGDGTSSQAINSNTNTSRTFTQPTTSISIAPFNNRFIFSIDCGASSSPRLSGTVDMSSFSNIESIRCNFNDITAINGYNDKVFLRILQFAGNKLTAPISSLSANIALQSFNCRTNQITGSIPSFNTNVQLIDVACYSNQFTGSIPSLSANTQLTTFLCHINQLTGFQGGSVSNTLGNFQAQANQLTTGAVNAILAAFVAANRTTGSRILNLGGTGNAAPTGQGITDKATLQSRGWTVTTN